MTSTAQKQEAVTSQQTKILVKNMMRISVSSICFHRDCFPPDCFSFRNYGNMKVIQLDAAELDTNENLVIKNEKAFLLTQWLEKGVFKALEDGLLTALSFAIYTEHPITKEDLLLETYEFKFNFSVGNQVSINGVVISSKDDIKSQAAKFVRNLISFTQTLDDLPKNNWITMQMRYKDEAPPDYEPEYFTATSESSLIFPDISCLRVKLGSIETSQMRTESKFVGLESLLHEDLCQIKVPLRMSTQHLAHNASSFQVGVKQVDRVDALVDSMCGTSLLDTHTNVNANNAAASLMNEGTMELGGDAKANNNNNNNNNNEDTNMDYEPQLPSKAKAKPAGKSKGSATDASTIPECAANDVERVKSHISQSDGASASNIVQTCSLSKTKVDAIIKTLLGNSIISRKASSGYNSRFFVLNTSALDAFAQTAALATSTATASTTKAADITPVNNAPAHAANPPKLTKRKVASISEDATGDSNIENNPDENADPRVVDSGSSGQRSKRLASKEKQPASPPETQDDNAEAEVSRSLATASVSAASSVINNNSRYKKVEAVKGKGGATSTSISAQSVADDIENSFESQSEHASSKQQQQSVPTSATYAKSQLQSQGAKTQSQKKQQPASIFPELSSIVKKSGAGDAKDKENDASNNNSINKMNNNSLNSNNINNNIIIKKQQQQSASGWHNTTNTTSDRLACDDISSQFSQFSQFSQQDSVQTSQDNGHAMKFGRIANPIEIVRTWAKEKQ